ncbi:sulfite exporter TauE/SafE family protein [Suttonella sp. R2A3]|uniref:sulfite exporter TauE/SafE family protein n=1 Tax=Suttonella sp. R2A3 TaxID=2908648 RepID=UPI001F1B8DC2|nr:sulfite exporter TauE/SafE family protein [Suttonella sp. R2A3]UJF23652.1 sulfite exporter TauE/SafE family protein [Suttonella sp. R2A3]
MDWFDYSLLATLGVAAGIINMMAGGGSNLILPALMIMGVPPDVANGTNRVGVFLQSVVGIRQFHRAGRMPLGDLPLILLPTLIGSLVGALLAAFAPNSILKPTLLLTMLAMAALMLFRPSIVMPSPDTPPNAMRDTPSAWYWLFLAGVYGGFVQAGVGFVLITALAGSLRYNLVSANALKVVCTLFFTFVALIIFIWQGQVWWIAGLILAAGNMLGAVIGVKIAISVSTRTLKWLLFTMTLAAVVAALFSD